ncbi:MAG: enoyl-CoA hydratase/isomerase family protein, partial [Candidatus Rokubacteria bacterium]|nr:enoyl-CoA hydratase/isomerase family protein [Candidatus Rokubacteria bacterium]
MSSSYKTLNVTAGPDDHVVTVEFNRPEALNAMNTAMGEDLLRCFDALQWDKAVRVVVLTGSGTRAFCVGGDLKERQGMTDEVWRAQHVIFELNDEKRYLYAGVRRCYDQVIALAPYRIEHVD